MIDAIAEDPLEGEIIPGTGGARKRRFAGRGRGKSGGYRVISFYAGDDVGGRGAPARKPHGARPH
jgi:hypothetical protein